jgi:hypothetical protein
MSSAICCLHGRSIPIEIGISYIFPPSSHQNHQEQVRAPFVVIPSEGVRLYRTFGPETIILQPIQSAATTHFTNASVPEAKWAQIGTVGSAREVVDFLEQKLKKKEVTANNIRDFIGLQYCGSILYAFMIRAVSGSAEYALTNFQKAREFINLANHRFKVQRNGAYKTFGSSFLPSFRAGNAVAEAITFSTLRGIATALKVGCIRSMRNYLS